MPIFSRRGVLSGTTITLDVDVPAFEGMKVRVLIEPAEEIDLAVPPGDQIRLWQEWAARGPQGPLDEGELPEKP